MIEDLQFVIIIATLLLTIVSVLLAFWRLEYAKRQYEISVKMLEESRNYWQKRMAKDRKRGKRT